MRGALLAALSISSLPLAQSLVIRQENATLISAAASATSGGSAPSGSASAPKATIYPQTSTGEPVVIKGTSNPTFKHDSYLGIPFAAPPVGDLRLAFPEDPTWNTTSFSAKNYSASCLQAPSAAYDAYGQSEDCLYLNVFTPQGIDSTQQSLPVMVWVYGGAFTSGAASLYDPTVIMLQAQLTNKPIVFVSVNYRLGIFGFPGGKQVAEAGIANLGLRDVKKSLEWVQNNIWAFGGDAGSVTVFGQSAGAILTSLLYLDPEQKLFKSAIMESGAQSVAPIAPTDEFWQGPFDIVQNLTNCSAPVTISDNATASRRWSSDLPPEITCLKYVPAEDLLMAQLAVQNTTQYGSSFVFAPSIDGDIIPESPHDLLSQGQFSHAPFISGNTVDEGTLFVPRSSVLNYTQDQLPLFVAAFEPIPPENVSVLAELGTFYPNDPSVGSPFGTGNQTFGLPDTYKQAAAILGDATFQASRRWFLQNAEQYNPGQSWSYQWARAPPGTQPALGVPHSSEVIYVFGVPQAAAQGQDTGAVGLLSRGSNYTDADVQLSQAIINYWLNFAYYSDPNGDGSSGAPNWPEYGDDLNLLFMNVSNVTVIPDTYREAQINYFLANPTTFNYKRWLGLE